MKDHRMAKTVCDMPEKLYEEIESKARCLIRLEELYDV